MSAHRHNPTHADAWLVAPDNAQTQQHVQTHFSEWVTGITPNENEHTARAIEQAFAHATARNLYALLDGAPASVVSLPAGFATTPSKRLVAAHAVLFALDGVPAIHLAHLLGKNDFAQMTATQTKAYDALKRLLHARATHAAFALGNTPAPLYLAENVFAVVRSTNPKNSESNPLHLAHKETVVCLVNLSENEQLISPDWRTLLGTRHAIRDLVSGVRFNVHGPSLSLQPFQVLWATV